MSRRWHGSVGGEVEALRIWLLGGFKVSIGSTPIEKNAWRLRKAAALLKLLSIAPGHRLYREQVMDALWPELGKKAAANNLRRTLHAARVVLDPTGGSRFLASDADSLVLCPGGSVWVDVDAFEEAALSARRSRDSSAYRAAIDLYTGNLLPEDRYEEWTEGRREELRQLYLALFIELAGLYEERDEYGPAIEALREATAKDPTLEEAHAALMRVHALSGRPEQAIAQYERLRDTLTRNLGTEPGATIRRLRDEIAAGRVFPTIPTVLSQQQENLPSAGKHNLPAARTTFVGREGEMVEVKRTLSMTRLLTLTGAGGTGKTRLALEVTRDLVGAYPDGAWMVELASLSEPDLVAQEVAGALAVSERPGLPLTDALVEALADKEMLLVMDNCEHLVDAAAQLVDALLDSCPRIKVLATSREPLGVSGEVNWTVPPLSLPAVTDGTSIGRSTVESLMRYEAVKLFVDRARLRLPDFQLTQQNAGATVRVCRKLDGIPLAIELASARMGALAVEQVAQRLEVSLDVLKGASRTSEARQQTLRATIDWSYNLLNEAERELFGRLSAFAGGWMLEAAESVCSGGGIEQEDVLDLLGALVDKSLVVARTSMPSGILRYRMLEPIRQYAREKLEVSGEVDEVQGRHVSFFLALAEEAKPQLAGPQQRVWVERLEGEHDNLRAALSWVLQRGETELALRFGGALWRFWFQGGYLSEGVRWLEQALAGGEPADATVRVKALEGMGWLTQAQGDTERAKATYEEMMELSRELDDKGDLATALNSLGMLAAAQGDTERATSLIEENLAVLRELEEEENAATVLKRYHALNLLGTLAINEEGDYTRGAQLFKESLALAREAKDAYRVTASLVALQYVAVLQGNYERATALYEEALALSRELGTASVQIIPEALVNLGLAALGQGHHQRAVMSFKEALVMSQNSERKSTVINALEGMASVAGALGDATRSAHLWGAAETARAATGIVLPPGERTLHEPYLAAARSRLGEVLWEEALASGHGMSLEEATEYALAKDETEQSAKSVEAKLSASDSIGNLTSREQEIVVLVARGLTNRQISTQLGISERTAGNHVGRILRKLRLQSRAQVATWAAERRLLAPYQL